MPGLSRLRSFLPPILLIAMVGTIAAAVARFAVLPGGLQVAAASGKYGNSRIRTGPMSYPREALDSDGLKVSIPQPSRRIISQSSWTDEFLYSVVPPQYIIGVSPYAFDPQESNVLALATKYRPAVATDLERVVRLNPDLMLVSSTGRADLASLARAADLTVYRMYTMFTTLDQVAESIRLTGYLTGNDESARVEEERFRSTVGRAIAMRPPDAPRPRILGLSGHLAYGRGTLLNDIIEKLGGINVAAEGGLRGYDEVNSEAMLRWNPDWIVTSADPGKADSVRDGLLADPVLGLTAAARNRHVLVLDNRVFFPLSPFTSVLVTRMAEALYAPPDRP